MNAERPPDLMLPEERLAEVAQLLARGYLRLRRKQREKALALCAESRAPVHAGGEVAACGKEQG